MSSARRTSPVSGDEIWMPVPSELGTLALVAGPGGLRGLMLPGRGTVAGRVHRAFPAARRGTSPLLTLFADELRLYLAGGRPGFIGPLDYGDASPFEQAVWEATRTIPYGETRTYRWVAGAAGDPSALRAAGQALGRNPLPIVVPCHRVVAGDGGLGGFSAGPELKRALLRLEGSGPMGQFELPLTTP